ncbi:MAG: glutamyl-tRNA amidotransferase [Clostridiales bacterium]|nr:glutamyl-tRNA amidotransferase [Clostridiales bacterium]
MKMIRTSTHLKRQEDTSRLIRGKSKKALSVILSVVIAVTLMCVMALAVFADGNGDPLAVVNNLSSFIFGLIRAIGLILLGFGIVQVGLSLKSHDPSQRANGFLTVAGGVIITFAKEILSLITG